jgi:hypothetical protein
VVNKLIAAAYEEGTGNKYLIQHSAGSGKSNSIAWTAHQLSCLHNEKGEKRFHSVIVVTDRTVLDDQLQDTIYQFEHADGVVGRINNREGKARNRRSSPARWSTRSPSSSSPFRLSRSYLKQSKTAPASKSEPTRSSQMKRTPPRAAPRRAS